MRDLIGRAILPDLLLLCHIYVNMHFLLRCGVCGRVVKGVGHHNHD